MSDKNETPTPLTSQEKFAQIHSKGGFFKVRGQQFGPYDGAYSDNGDISRFAPEIRNPTLNPEMFFLPRFISTDGSPNIELNNWLAHYLRFHPLVNNLISLHSTLPFSRFGLVGVGDTKVLGHYEQVAEDIQMFERCIEMAFQYFGLGEVYPFFHWDENEGACADITLLDPNRINVKGHYMFHSKKKSDVTEIYEYMPDEVLKQMVMSTNPNEQRLVNNFLNPKIKMAVENGLTVLLNPFSVGVLRRKIQSFDLRGTSILLNALKVLMLEDKLREQQYAFAQANVNPYIIWKIGSSDGQFMPDSDQLEEFRSMVQSLAYDSQKNIVTHPFLELEIKGASGQFDHMTGEFDYIENQILTSLWASKAFTHNDNISLNSSTVQMRMLMSRYLPIRNMFENVFYRKVFMPMALKHKYFKRTQAELDNHIRQSDKTKIENGQLMLPRFDWRHKQSLLDDPNTRNMLQSLQQTTKLPMRSITDSLDLDYEYTMNYMKKEHGTVWDNDMIEMRKAILQSAAQGKLKEPEVSIKAIMDAVAKWDELVLNHKPYAEVVKKTKEEQTELEEKVKRDENRIIKKERKKDIEQLEKDYLEDIKATIEKPIEAFKPTFDSKTLFIESLKKHNYPTIFIQAIKDQLYDVKISLATEQQNYVYRNQPIQGCINRVLLENQPAYFRRLYDCKNAIYDGNMNFDNYYLKLEKPDVDIDKPAKNEYWKENYKSLERQIVGNFINLYHKAKVANFKKQGKKEVIYNKEKVAIAELEKIENFKLTDKWID